MSFYLKYRPAKIDDLDLKKVRQFFLRLLDAGQVSHAYLFTGPRGTGKTSAARILAKIVNCERNKKSKKFSEPCNRCISCKSVVNGNNVDLIEIDAASNRGIDDIRDLKEKIRLSPVASKKKVYIIDEVHMLTTEAFNALLKTLEEPPQHALFVLATTEAHKVPETIKSRCVRLNFDNADFKEVIRSLNKVVRGEKLKIDKEALAEIARAVNGSFREGMKILEQLSLTKKKITAEMVKEEVGRGGEMTPVKLLQFLEKRELVKALKEIENLGKKGINWQVLVAQILENLRLMLLDRVGVEGIKLAQEYQVFKFTKQELLALIGLCIKAGKELKQVDLPQLALEVVCYEWCGQNTRTREHENIKTTKKKLDLPEKAAVVQTKPVVVAKPGKVSLEQVEQKWGEVLAKVKPHNHSIEGLLRSTKPKEVVGNVLKIEVFYQFHMDQLSQKKYLAIVEQAVFDVFATSLKLEYHLGQKPTREQVAAVENISATEDDDILKVAEEVFGA